MADPVLRRLIEVLNPIHVLEIAEGGSRADLILAGSEVRMLESMGTMPAEQQRQLQASFGRRFRRRDGLVLNAVSTLEVLPDLVILGGHPNWYTVHQSLRLIERRADSNPLPVMLIRDVGWPYARRDGYPDPQVIPIAYLKPNSQEGLVPPASSHGTEDGLFGDIHNSLFENTEQTGVLTAVEDYCSGSNRSFRSVVIPGFGGVCLLADERRLEQSAELGHLLDDFRPQPQVAELLCAIENARIDALITASAQHRLVREQAELEAELHRLRAGLAAKERELEDSTRKRRANDLRLVELDASLASLKTTLTQTETELHRAGVQISELEGKKRLLAQSESAVLERDATIAQLQARIAEASTSAEPKRPAASAARSRGSTNNRQDRIARALALVVPGDSINPSLDLARRRFTKLRRDPKLFFQHSRFAMARRISQLM